MIFGQKKIEAPKEEIVLELEEDPKEREVRLWRYEQLLKAGFSEFAAFRLSMVNDWHRSADMLRNGATEEFVLDYVIDCE